MNSQFQRLSKVLAKTLAVTVSELETCFYLADSSVIPVVSKMRRQIYGDEIKEDDERYLNWRYFQRQGYASTLWVFEYKGDIIGALGTEPVELKVKDRMITAVRSMDIIVDPKYDGRGIGAWMNLLLQDKYQCILVSGGNASSLSMLKKMYVSVPVRQDYKLLIRSESVVADRVPKSVSAVGIRVANIALAVINQLRSLKLEKIPMSSAQVVQNMALLIESMPDQIGVLGEVKAIRSQRYLRWRYLENPRNSFEAAVLYQDEQMLGWMIFCCSPMGEHRSSLVGNIVDWDAYQIDQADKIVQNLLHNSILRMAEVGVEQVSVRLNDDISAAAARKMGFHLRGVDERFFVYAKDSGLQNSLTVTQDWYHSFSDSDGI